MSSSWPGAAPARTRVVGGIAALAAAILWAQRATDSLWADELGGYWVISDGAGEAVERATRVHGQTPLPYLVAWALRHILGGSELALRIPSYIAMAIATVLLYRLARRLFGTETAVFAGALFVLSGRVAFAASDARPYALATAASLAASLAAVRWCDERRSRDAVLAVMLSLLTIYLHYLFALPLVATAAFCVSRRVRMGYPSLRGMAGVAAGIAVGLVPAVPQARALVTRRDDLSVPVAAPYGGVVDVIGPAALAAGIVAIGWIAGRIRGTKDPAAAYGALLYAALAFALPPTVLAAMTRFGGVGVLADRYLLTAAPGLALLIAWLLARALPGSFRPVGALAVGAAFALSAWSFVGDFDEGWDRGLAVSESALRRGEPVLLHTGFIEARRVALITDPGWAGFIDAPTVYYRVEQPVITMPREPEGEGERYLAEVVLIRLEGVEQFALVTRYPLIPLRAWLEERIPGLRSRPIGRFGDVEVFLFTRTRDA